MFDDFYSRGIIFDDGFSEERSTKCTPNTTAEMDSYSINNIIYL